MNKKMELRYSVIMKYKFEATAKLGTKFFFLRLNISEEIGHQNTR